MKSAVGGIRLSLYMCQPFIVILVNHTPLNSRPFDHPPSHTDYGSVTLLFQHEVGGLEVQAGRSRWISTPVIPGIAIINLGDCLEYWTNGLFKSTQHRVVFRQDTATRDRYSMVYFCQGYEVSLDPVPSRMVPVDEKKVGEGKKAITAAEHLKMRLATSYQYYTAE